MIEDIRNADPVPTAEEIEWMNAEPMPWIVRVAVMYAIAVVAGMGMLAY